MTEFGPVLPTVARLAAGVRRVIAPNPSMMTGPGTNSYLFGDNEVAVLDPGPLIESHLKRLQAEAGAPIRWILVTHTHPDHSPGAVELARQTGAELLGMPAPEGAHQDKTFVPDRILKEGDRLTVGGAEIEAIHTPGHASNHLCYRQLDLNWLFTGDHVIDGSTVVIDPPDGNMSHYLQSLQKLKPYQLAALAPGHGDVIDDPDRAIDWIVEHRLEREAKVVAALLANPNLTSHELVPHVYKDVDERLYGWAERSLLAHLLKLVDDGKASRASDRWAVVCVRLRISLAIAVVILAGIFFFKTDSIDGQAVFDAATESTRSQRSEHGRASQADEGTATVENSSSLPGSCPDKSSTDLEPHDSDWMRERASRQAKALSATNDAEYLLAAALLSNFQGPDESLALLDRAARLAPSNRIIASTRLRICRESKGSECDMDRVVANALKVDGDNGAVIMEVAMLSLTANRIAEAEALVRRAADAPRFDNYYIDYAIVLERAAATRGDANYRDRMIEGFGYSAAMSVSYYKITSVCSSVEKQNVTWLALCDDLGKKMYTDGRSLLDNLIGVSLRKIAAKQSGVESRIEATTAEHKEFRQYFMTKLLDQEGQGLLENDEGVLRRYVDTFSTYGELGALQILSDEVQRLKILPGYDLCNLVPTKL